MSKNYTLLVGEILVSLRKKLSQEQINRKMKFKTNQVARWESGHAKIDWASLCQLADVTQTPLQEALRKHLFFDDKSKDQIGLVQFLTHFHSQKFLAEQLGCSKSFISKLISGKSQLTFEILLQLIEISPYSLPDFVSALTFPNIPASIAQEQELIAQEKELHFTKPWTAALILYLHTEDYQNLKKHSDHFLSLKLGIPEEAIREALATLEKLQIVQMKENIFQAKSKHLSTGGSFEGAKNIRKYWLNQCQKAVEKSQPGQNHYFGYKVFNISNASRKKLEDFYFRMNAELDTLIKNEKVSDQVMLFSFQMLNVDQTKSN